MILSFKHTVSALVYSVIHEQCQPEQCQPERAVNGFPHNQIARFVVDQHRRMPDYLRLPFIVLTLFFDAWGMVASGQPFHRLPHDRRWQQIQRWREARLSFCRDFVRFYESLAIFSCYAIRHERA